MTVAQRLRDEGRNEGWNEGIQLGRQEGKLEGIQEGKLDVARSLLKAGMSYQTVLELTRLTESELQKILPATK